MEYSSIMKYDPREGMVHQLSWRGGGETIPSGLPVAVLAAGDLENNKCFDKNKFVVLAWYNFTREDMRQLLKLEGRFRWGSNNYIPSVIFERERDIEALSNDQRFIEAINAWAGKTVKYGEVKTIRTILKRVTRNGRDKIYFSFKGEVIVLGPSKL